MGAGGYHLKDLKTKAAGRLGLGGKTMRKPPLRRGGKPI